MPILVCLVYVLAATGISAVKAVPQFNIVDFGAAGDGKTINTAAIQRAIAAAHSSTKFRQYSHSVPQAGLGQAEVVVPAGRFLSGGIRLLDGVFLRLATNASVLLASDRAEDYECVPSETTDTGPCDYPLVSAVGATHTGIVGPGIINGGANDPPGHLVAAYNETLNMLIPATLPFKEDPYNRVKLVVFKQCLDVLIRDVQLLNSPLWTCTLVQCTDVLIDSVTIIGDRRWPNNDGVDPISSVNVTIQNSFISTGDDCICISTHVDAPAERIVMRNLTVASTSAALKLGGFCLGAYRDIVFDSIRVLDTNRGICLMPRWGGGNFTNISFTNIEMETRYFSTGWWGTAEAISFTSLEYTGTASNIRFENITSRSESGVVVYGESGTLADIVFQNVSISIGKWSNYSHPCFDLRPCSNCTELLSANTDAIYAKGLAGAVVTSAFAFDSPREPYWGTCYNVSTSVVMRNNTCKVGLTRR